MAHGSAYFGGADFRDVEEMSTSPTPPSATWALPEKLAARGQSAFPSGAGRTVAFVAGFAGWC